MTEAEWLRCLDASAMIVHIRGKVSLRKWRLFACVIARQLEALLAEEPTRLAIEAAEAFADDSIAGSELALASDAVQQLVVDAISAQEFDRAASLVYAGRASAPLADEVVHLEYQFHSWVPVHSHALRDIFGNPFRQIEFDPNWRTSTAVAIAAQMYESRDFSAMPILADALQDAVCDNNDILNHCRDTDAQHVRGCWVVDLVLGKA